MEVARAVVVSPPGLAGVAARTAIGHAGSAGATAR
jgi:hypothetical protein